MDEAYHASVTEKIGGKANYGKGIWPNPYIKEIKEYKRRTDNHALRTKIAIKVAMLTEPRFITNCETSELLGALVTMTSSTKLLELGMLTGVTSLHLLQAIIGKPGAELVSIDCDPAYDKEFFHSPELSPYFKFIHGKTPEALGLLRGQIFDFVFIDSDHSLEHTQIETAALMAITRKGTMFCYHDVPEWTQPGDETPPPVRVWLLEQIKNGTFSGMMLPSPRQLDCEIQWSPDYDTRCSPGLAVMIRN